jgi:hypothetical protein
MSEADVILYHNPQAQLFVEKIKKKTEMLDEMWK